MRIIDLSQEGGNRVDQIHKPYKNNKIQTSKYTPYNFLFKNLLLQFSKAPNLYFFIIMFMQMIPSITITEGKPS